ncbi:hypothetical protein [Picrophilus oshimae]|nr:hypothetical protein [Picrophilus oshimae]
MILKSYIKSLFSSRTIWFWSVGFIIFWLFLGVFVFPQDINKSSFDIINYASLWYSLTSILSVAAIGVSISFSIYYSSSSLAYLFHNSKLSSYRYYLESSVATGLFFTGTGTVLMMFMALLFYIRFHVIVYPHIFWLALILFFSSGLFFYSLSAALVVIFNNWLGLKNINFVAFIPLFLGYGFGYSALYGSLPHWLLYSNFVSPYEYLYMMSFTGRVPFSNILNHASTHASILLCSVSVLIWMVIFIFAALLLIKSIKASYVEEARQI